MEIKIHRYELPWPSHASRSHLSKGALLAIKNNSNLWGYADLHPWPSMGDLDLEPQIDLLREGKPSHQTQLSLMAAQHDLQARESKKKLVNYSPLIQNHHLILDENFHLNSLRQTLFLESLNDKKHFPLLLKWKISPHTLPSAIQWINQLSIITDSSALHWRLDFNSLFSSTEVMFFWSQLLPQAQKQIEFIEDPCPYSADTWGQLEELNIPLAIDFELKKLVAQESNASTEFSTISPLSKKVTLVLKPAIQNMDTWFSWIKKNQHPFIITSYLDHPIGLLHALHWAELFQKEFGSLMRVSGLSLSLSASELTHYWPSLVQHKNQGNYWFHTEENDYGIGFTQKLESLSWQQL